MRIQIITEKSDVKALDVEYVSIRHFNKPLSFDDFDIVIIDLSDDSIWKFSKDGLSNVNMVEDFISVRTLARNRKKCRIIYALPQNSTFLSLQGSTGTQYLRQHKLKDMIPQLHDSLLRSVIPSEGQLPFILIYEPTYSIISDIQYQCDFCFFGAYKKTLTQSERGGKPNTIEALGVIYTTLNFLQDSNSLRVFLTKIGLLLEERAYPEWLSDIEILDDKEIKKLLCLLSEDEKRIGEEKKKALEKLQKNLEFKSILTSTGDYLVEIVFEILEIILGYSLKNFVDTKKEDFLIKLPTVTFIGEIKGIGTNVKNAHVSQTDVHTQTYKDQLEEASVVEEVKSILIINPFRTKALVDREPVAQAQIELAERQGCLIITTEVLLKLFEKFKRGELNSKQIINILRVRNGLLNLD